MSRLNRFGGSEGLDGGILCENLDTSKVSPARPMKSARSATVAAKESWTSQTSRLPFIHEYRLEIITTVHPSLEPVGELGHAFDGRDEALDRYGVAEQHDVFVHLEVLSVEL